MTSVSTQIAQEQLEEITNQQPVSKQAKAVKPNKQAARSFNARLQQLVNAIKKDINERIVPLVRSLEPLYIGDSAINDAWPDDIMEVFASVKNKWRSAEFAGASKSVASDFVKAMNIQNSKRFTASVKPVGVTGLDIFGDSPKLTDLLSASIADNTRLITSIPEQYLENVQSVVMSNMRAGLRPSAIVKQLQEQYGITQRRATLIARDQTSKANGELSKQRQEDAGFEYFRWSDSDDARVRDRHEKLSNQDIGFGKGVYRWDNPPKNDKGAPIIPGQEINCRCIAQPVTNKQVEQNKKSSV